MAMLTKYRSMADHQTFMSLKVLDFPFHPDTIGDMLGLQCSESWQKGDYRSPKVRMRHKENGWQLKSPLGDDAGFEDHLKCIIDAVYPSRMALQKLSKEYYTELSCAIYMAINSEKSLPSMHIDEEQIRILAEMNLQIDVDLYLTQRK